MSKEKPRAGTRVRFTAQALGACEYNDHGRFTQDTYGPGNTGIVDPQTHTDALAEWIYVCVDSKSGPKRKLLVPCLPAHYEALETAAERPAGHVHAGTDTSDTDPAPASAAAPITERHPEPRPEPKRKKGGRK